MGLSERVIAAISRIHAAGLDPAVWPEALSLVTELIGGKGASLEFLERPTLRPSAMFTHGLPDVGPYIEHYAPQCPRLPYAARQPAGALCYDALCTSEAEMNRNPFYAELLAPLDMRYFVGAVIANSAQEIVISGVQLSPKQGHPGPAKIKMMAALTPHIQQAADVMRRLTESAKAQGSFEDMLDWLADGALKLAIDGSIRYANLAAQRILRRNDGIAVCRGALEFLSAQAGVKFAGALKAVRQLRDGKVTGLGNVDFIAETRSGAPPFSISIRPASAAQDIKADVVALMFIHDPLSRDAIALELLKQAFGLTPAEADVANALSSGLSAGAYADQRKLSPNTVYTHIRRIKEKVGSKRTTELIRKLNDLHITAVHKR